MQKERQRPKSLKTRRWQYTYRTSSAEPGARPADILHDFYIPALSLSIRYDRMAGYFRSTSLAAASQGFSAFTATAGKMRLVVGADLNEEDIRAILKGHEDLMARRLNEELEEPGNWPGHVTRGVELLSWMVARGALEVRVAFRIHVETGKPLPFSSAEDGYVHEKWAVFTDEEGNRLYVTGSLNESRTALVMNAENIDVHADWWNEIARQRADDAQAAFENIWNDQNPHLRVLPLPEAVRQRLIRIGEAVRFPEEIDGSSAHRPEVEPPSAIERLRFAVIKDGPRLPGGRFVGIETAPIEPWPHQEIVARRLVETWPYSYLLCDEVGLGKTIEAALAIRALYLSGLARRVLVTPPAGLTRQWQRELESKFFLPFARALPGATIRHKYLFPLQETRQSAKTYDPDLCIVSTGLLSRKERWDELQRARPFDIVLVDEAHYARRKNPRNGARSHPQFGNLYLTIRDHLQKKTPCLWMATATPMQIDWIEVFDLLSLTNRVSTFQFDPSLAWTYYRILGALVRDQDIKKEEWDFLRRSIASLDRYDPFLREYLKEAVIDGRIRTAARQWLERGRIPVGADKRHIRRLIFSAAPLSRVMLRHTRPLLEIYREKGRLGANLAKRNILPVPRIVMTPLEKRAYDELETYCRDLTAQITAHAKGRSIIASLGFLLSSLRLRFASSLFAIKETIKRRKERVTATLSHLLEEEDLDYEIDDMESLISEGEDIEDRVIGSFLKHRTPEDLSWERERLSEMLTTLEDLSETPSKMKELLSVLDRRRLPGGRIQQTVIFTRFYDTLQDIVKRLREIDPSMLIGTYSGKGGQYVDPRTRQLCGVERNEIKHRFLRQEIDILICTDAAAEGLNLQTADLLINYDLPWNPMKVEQRIGRIDRIGQKHEEIYVLNLCYVDSAEQIVYDRLLRRLTQAEDIVGLQQISILPVRPEEFNDLAAGVLSAEELESRARECIAHQRQRTDSMEIPAKDLYEIYMRLEQNRRKEPAPVVLDSIWEALSTSKHLKDLGCMGSDNENRKYMVLHGIETVPSGTALTIDRSLYEHGIPGMEGRLHFASYGDPIFQMLLDKFEQYDLPPCVARITEKVPDTHAEVVAYAAACLSKDGFPHIRLVTSWNDLNGLRLDESFHISEPDLTGVKERLHNIVRQEFEPTRAVGRLEYHNKRAGRAQIIMDLLSISSLIQAPVYRNIDNFWTIVKDHLDVLIDKRERLIITDLPVKLLDMVRKELLFDFQVPKVGTKTTITVPIYQISVAVDAGCRIADAMKVKKSELTVKMVLSRIERELKKEIKLMNP